MRRITSLLSDAAQWMCTELLAAAVAAAVTAWGVLVLPVAAVCWLWVVIRGR